jgi:hypothetical protein
MAFPVILAQPRQVWRGDRYALRIEFRDSDGNPIDMSGLGVSWSAAIKVHASSDVAATFEVDTTAVTVGDVTLRLTKDETRALDCPLYGWDLQADSLPASDEGPTTVTAGRLQVAGDYAP